MAMAVSGERFIDFTRRVFLQLLGWAWTMPAIIVLRQFSGFIGYQPPGPDPTIIPLGTLESLPPLPAHIERALIFLLKDDGGYYALDNVCTHLGCLIHPQPDGSFACPCHGSRYAADGQVIRGPATRPLPYLELQRDGAGQIFVLRSKQVAATFRLPPA